MKNSKSNLTIKDMQTFASTKDGKCLSKYYINAHIHLNWQCSCKFRWKAVWNSIQRGSWCPKCGEKKKGSTQRLTIESIHKLANTRGGRCLSKEYNNTHQSLLWQCKEGHQWNASTSSIKSGSWCNQCSVGVNEQICRSILQSAFGLKFIKIKPNWLLNSRGNKMELDGYNKKLNLAFEYQGIQHFKEEAFFNNRARYSLKQRKNDDKRKKDLCNLNDLNLIIIPYTIKKKNISRYIFEKCKNFGYRKNSNLFKWSYKDIYHRHSDQLNLIKLAAVNNRGKCLSKNYIDSKHKLKFQCKKKHEWSALPQPILKGVWCPTCGRAKAKESQKHDPIKSIKLMSQLAKNKDGKCLSSKYLGIEKKLLWQCKEGHKWKSLPYVIRSGHWCPVCSKSGPNAKKDIKFCHDLAKKNEGECLSKNYKGIHEKLKWRCKKNHVWLISPHSINRGSWCSRCGRKTTGDKLRKSIKEAQIIAKKNKGICLSKNYENCRIKLKWKCEKGHEWESGYSNIKSGRWCPRCGREKAWKTRKLGIL